MRLVPDTLVDRLRTELVGRQGLRSASIDVPNDPFDFARTGAALVDRAVAFAGPDGVRVAGLGTAWRAASSGPARFTELRDRIGDSDIGDRRAFLGFSFLDEPRDDTIWSGYAAAEAFVPRIGIEGTDDGATITVTVPSTDDVEPTLGLLASMRTPEWVAVEDSGDHTTESHPPIAVWAGQVDAALKAIGAGDIDKVVLARSVVVTGTESPPILRLFRSLVRSYPQCYNFAWKSGEGVFLGASPELLGAVRDGRFSANPLAGSAPRGEGSDEDDAIGRLLLSSEKDRREHAYVVDGIAAAMASCASDITAPATPALKKLASVQHLSSTVTASMNDGTGLLDAIDAIHPTAAVGGAPTAAAVDLIEHLESVDR
ncbi:MAG: chorismate-binding protein, partial [Acidimicrobiia bacterium]|nr:chorismate-binding protein [Acidimicrobiia bacterium]